MGEIVELGCFFGSLSLPIAEGLIEWEKKSNSPGKQALTYDLFVADHTMTESFDRSPLKGLIKQGDSFEELYRRNTAHLEGHIHSEKADLSTREWDGRPIEILLVDCMKADAITHNVVQTYMSAIIPGKGYLLHQDYFHFYEWWTHLITFEQRDYLEKLDEVPESGMCAFSVKSPLAAFEYDRTRSYRTVERALIDEAYDWNYTIISPHNHPNLRAAQIWAYYYTGELEAARRLYAESPAGFRRHYQFEWLIGYLEEIGDSEFAARALFPGLSFPLRHGEEPSSAGYFGMSSFNEQSWISEYAAARYSQEGGCVDLGCFLGASSLAIADGFKTGIAQGRLTDPVVHAYDLFYFHPSMYDFVSGTMVEEHMQEGEWFFELFEANTKKESRFIRPHWEDLGKATWIDGPIEILLLDCLKYDEITNNVIPGFFNSLIPGKAILVHQGYYFFFEWWTHLLVYEQREYLEPVAEIKDSRAHVFRVIKPFDEYLSGYDRQRNFADVQLDAIDAAYAWNKSFANKEKHWILDLARCWAYFYTGHSDRGNDLFSALKTDHSNELNFQYLENHLVKNRFLDPPAST